MKNLQYFKLVNCPYCRQADRWIDELTEENPAYKDIQITRINEDEQPELANRFDYFYVPCFYQDNHKIHEGAASKEIIRKVLDACLA